jgi:hypothetical protein
MTPKFVVLIIGFLYSVYASFLAYRESGESWMLFFPTWVDPKCGISRRTRWHGKIAFVILFAGVCWFLV